ncbi:hypothetical protein [Lactobacillus crispatus]|uniref:Uncharacterized protein n=1 Tax=Lactobacillus crispatus TaxID=47770 RepID=A0A7X4HP12_9LACO|nr:hypothetical protein [Lactobacillus crispatus]KAA8791818.1 hypothetical protein F1B99_09540 [Lactobacillus crispatus]KAA8795949.1 hypothetical protein F1B96_08620 [Lactobacillus crispatus]KAA8798140.1 hypothetical protein F1C02_05145 [Lactobacillus crispatus]KAA8800063.1 hypothetical protein F1C04_10770 [Lactobacillus crispatus]KAA8800069.1 hypothetical protein F1C03_09285 [Lactobacillus crispatus]
MKMWITIVLVSFILAYLFRVSIIYNAFKNIGIKLTMLDSFKILYLLTKNYLNQLITLRKNKKNQEYKILNKIYWLFFDTLLVSLTTILNNAFNITDDNKVSIVPISHKNNIVKNVSITIPFLNESMASAA